MMMMSVAGQAAGKAVRLKNLDRLVVVNVHPVKRLAQSGVIGREQPRVLRLDGEMQVAHGPADDRRGVRLYIERDFQQELGLLADDVARLVTRPHDIAVTQRRLHLETEFRAVLRRGTPQPLGEFLSVHAQGNFGKHVIGRQQWGVDEMHMATIEPHAVHAASLVIVISKTTGSIFNHKDTKSTKKHLLH
jgi:hypothetical protein